MKTIYFPLIALMAIFRISAYAQHSPAGAHNLALEMLRKYPANQDLGNRGENARLDSTVCEIFGENAWEPDNKTFYRYDTEERLVKDSTIKWAPDPAAGPAWIPDVQQVYTYTNAGEVETITQIHWDETADAWGQDSFRMINEYVNGVLSVVWSEAFNTDLGAWENVMADSLVYDANGLLIQRNAWFFAGNGWTPIARVFYGYENGLLDADLFQFSFDGGFSWINFFRQFYAYQNGLLAKKRVEYYDEESGNFIESDLETYSYNADDDLVHTEGFIWIGEWFLYQRCDLYYSGDPSTGIDPLPVRQAVEAVFENPFPGGWIEVKGLEEEVSYQVSIVDGMGRQVFRKELDSESLLVPALPGPGMYLLLIQDGNDVHAIAKMVAAF